MLIDSIGEFKEFGISSNVVKGYIEESHINKTLVTNTIFTTEDILKSNSNSMQCSAVVNESDIAKQTKISLCKIFNRIICTYCHNCKYRKKEFL